MHYEETDQAMIEARALWNGAQQQANLVVDAEEEKCFLSMRNLLKEDGRIVGQQMETYICEWLNESSENRDRAKLVFKFSNFVSNYGRILNAYLNFKTEFSIRGEMRLRCAYAEKIDAEIETRWMSFI